MALDGKLLARAKTALDEKRRERDEAFDRRLGEAYAKCPRLRILDAEIRGTMADIIGAALGGGQARIEDIQLRNLDLQEERRKELLRAGFAADWLDEEYMCPVCRDTGYDGTRICGCLSELYKAEQRESLSSLFKLGGETFDSFDLSWYSDVPDQTTGVSPRRSMEFIYETCVEYARKFGKKSLNLFFNGAPGLGKTFLSASIARVVSESGHSVVYDTAASVFSKFEDAKFARTDDPDAARGEVKRCLECELLILDDLGTEMTTAFTVSALYELINTRLVTGKKTIISSNLTTGELSRRYSGQIMSRLEGEYQALTFRGEDIRKQKNRI